MIGLTFVLNHHPGIAMANAFDNFVETAINYVPPDFGDPAVNFLVGTESAMSRFILQTLQGYADLLRFGSGVDEAFRGAVRGDDFATIIGHLGEDALRALSIVPVPTVFGRGVARVSHLLAAPQAAGTRNCAWVVATHAARRTGQNLWMTDEQLLRTSGWAADTINRRGTYPHQFRHMIQGLRTLGVRCTPHFRSSLAQIEQLVLRQPDGVYMLGIKNGPGGRIGHQVYAVLKRNPFGRDVVHFIDTNREVYHGLSELAKKYPGWVLITENPVLQIPNGVIVRGNNFVQLFFPVGQVVASRIIEPAQRSRTPAEVLVSGQSRQDVVRQVRERR
jgi:hypothetical protein